jgi:hypothetical protein
MVLGVIGQEEYHKSSVLFISAYNGSCISHGETWVWSGVYIKREAFAKGTFMDLPEMPRGHSAPPLYSVNIRSMHFLFPVRIYFVY